MSGSITKTIRIRAVNLPYIERMMATDDLTWSGAVNEAIRRSREAEGVKASGNKSNNAANKRN